MVRAKKSLGQNFLNSKAVARDIVRAAGLAPDETVLEIGPGKGFLTAELLSSGAHVVAVEKDERMIPILQERFANEILSKQLVLLEGDIVEFISGAPQGPALTPAPKAGAWETLSLPPRYKLVANIPYYITGYLLRAFLGAQIKPEIMVLMVQKEVATRIVARDKKESILSISVKAYGAPHLVKKVPARYFTPAPRVDSAILMIDNISVNNFNKYGGATSVFEKNFFEILKAGFAHKRKVLAGNLKPLFGEKTMEILKSTGIKENARAEDVSLDQWLGLTALARNQQWG